jgi:hypothetical protein
MFALTNNWMDETVYSILEVVNFLSKLRYANHSLIFEIARRIATILCDGALGVKWDHLISQNLRPQNLYVCPVS